MLHYGVHLKRRNEGIKMHPKTLKGQRVQIRLDANSKNKLKRAAAYSHKTISQFMLANSLSAA
jgi:uncharacterized protein (DUF1778 family)